MFKIRKGDLATERHTLGVPPSVKISVDMKLADMDKICVDPEKNPKLIITRLQHYNLFLEKFLNLNNDEKEVIAKSMRDT